MHVRAYTPYIVIAVIAFLAVASVILLVDKSKTTSKQNNNSVSVVSTSNRNIVAKANNQKINNNIPYTNSSIAFGENSDRLYDREQDIRKNIFRYSLGDSNPSIICRNDSCLVSTVPTTDGSGAKIAASIIMLASGNYNDKLIELGFKPITFENNKNHQQNQILSVKLIKK